MATQKDRNNIPQNLQAEKTLLGSVLLDAASLSVAIEIIARDDFYSEAHQLIWSKMLDLSDKGRPIDLVTLADELAKEGLLDKAGGAAYLAQLTDGVPIGTNESVAEYARIIKEKSKLRSIINTSQSVLARAAQGEEDSFVLGESAIEKLYDIIAQQQTSGLIKLDKVFRQEMSTFESLMGGSTSSYGLPTGFTDLDSMIRGLQPGELIVVAARPSLGKTALCTCVALNIAKTSAPVGIFSLEMTRAALLMRMLCVSAPIDIWRLSSGYSTREDIQRAMRGINDLSKLPIWIDDTASLSITSFRAKARRLIQEHGARGFIIDYLQLMTSGKKFNNRNDEVGYLTQSLKAFAKEQRVPVVVLSQLSRENERGRPRKPRLSDLRDSGNIEQDADVVMFIHRPKQQEEDGDVRHFETVQLIIGKQRNGPTGELSLGFEKAYTRFVNMGRTMDGPEEVSVP